jgi:hypothetical protein
MSCFVQGGNRKKRNQHYDPQNREDARRASRALHGRIRRWERCWRRSHSHIIAKKYEPMDHCGAGLGNVQVQAGRVHASMAAATQSLLPFLSVSGAKPTEKASFSA